MSVTEQNLDTKMDGKGSCTQNESGKPAASSYSNMLTIIIATLYLVIISAFLLHSILQLWPMPTVENQKSEDALAMHHVKLLVGAVSVNSETRLWIVVAIAGALGGAVHALRSLYWYVGNKALVPSWLLMYLLLPLSAGILGSGAALLVRGGFLSPTQPVQQQSTYGFVALSFLVGMFTEHTSVKLRAIANTVFGEPSRGENSHPQPPGTSG